MTALAGLNADDTCQTVLAVPGMHCAGCMSKVERGLTEVAGVTAARVNLTARYVTVVHSPALTDRDLVAALEGIGFEAEPRKEALTRNTSAVKPLIAPLGVAAFAAMNVMLFSVSVWSGADGTSRELFHWISALIAIPATAYAGQPFFRSAWGAVRKGRTNMDVPISLGVLIATALSIYETIVGGRHAWFDGALMLLMFLLAGRVLDAMMRDRARTGVDALLSHAAQGAMIVADDGSLDWRNTEDLVSGMTIRIAAGERLAADGKILMGSSRFDQSLLTGESDAVPAQPGSVVLAGTLNLDAPVDVIVTATGQGTTLAEIARLMEAATQDRSTYVRLADRMSRYYAPAVHTLAALAFTGWMLSGAGIYQSLVIAVAVLIITCPCALGLAVPVAQVVASGALMRAGVMVKDGSALERLAQVDRALLDKTGTLTLGRPAPDPAVLANLPPDAAAIALTLASHSRHPISRALATALAAAGHRAVPLVDVEERAGQGVFAQWHGRDVALRRPEHAHGIAVTLDITGQPTWLIPFADRMRPDCKASLEQLAGMGIACSILSGDNPASVADVARETGLDAVAGASPADKQATIERLQDDGHRVLMVGDGLNDGPALARADASIAPGSASDVGLQASDLVFMQDSLLALPRAVRTARSTMRVVKQNFTLAIGYNVIAVPLAMAGMVTPMIAAIAMSGSSLIVIGNSLRLSRVAK
ncbi:putative cation transport ATPase [Caenibius tardaugens NBRC 16725]|uniref:Putative cation transport ATPase n=1 Tax=Caenibius tardaugens NBRC 16725 TaxID=1219035 RepID=U2ZWV5_9SPHN|nr:heavy metal translocating P-type ATPase [Caenibius tardaugens]AZI37632.1 cadmium-translocating P-type ATPase [Caenibius tardaugens NBRC 16725]GAD49834.1 putative cation transport ATPase [Caenibius tardaugens NBRC 16725]